MFYVYIHKKPEGDVFYVGKGTGDRAFSHDNRNIHWQRTVKKYGLEVQVLSHFSDEQEAFTQERLLIKSFRDSGVNLVNMTNGGEGAGGYKWTPEQVARWRASMPSNHMIGRKHSESTKAKIGAKHRGKKISPEVAAKISASLKGREFSEAHRAKLRETTKGGRNPSARVCVVHGQKFDCAADAARTFGLSPKATANRCGRGNDPKFQYV